MAFSRTNKGYLFWHKVHQEDLCQIFTSTHKFEVKNGKVAVN